MNVSNFFGENKTAVITGGSSGIGLAASVKCARLGMHVWILDIDEEDLPNAVEKVKSNTISQTQVIKSIICDVAKELDMKEAAKQIFSHDSTKSVHYLMNNAAVQLGGGGFATDMEIFHKVMGVNTMGPIHGCQAFVPTMQEKGQYGLIVNTGSKQGITSPPGNLTYNVSKAALKTWSEGFEHELMKERNNNDGKLYSALLIPGWVNTSIHLKELKARASLEDKQFNEDDVFFHEGRPAAGAWMPAQVIDFMMEELEKERFYILCPDNDVDRDTDNIRMTWAMQDITKNRAPLSRWHPEWSEKFKDYLKEQKK